MLARTGRLKLRELTLDDADFIIDVLNDPDFIRFVADRGVRTRDDAIAYLEGGPLAAYRRDGHHLWCVERLEDGARMGLCGLLRRDGLPDVDVGYTFLPAYRGQGYALEAARASVDYGRVSLGLARIVAYINPDNARSAHLLEQLGMQRQGLVDFPGSDAPCELYA